MLGYWKHALVAASAAYLLTTTPSYNQSASLSLTNAVTFTIQPTQSCTWCIVHYTAYNENPLNLPMNNANNVFSYTTPSNIPLPVVYSFTCNPASGAYDTTSYTLSTPTVQTSTIAGATNLGCFADSSTRALPNLLIASNASPQSCYNAAQASGFTYFGLQWYGQCFAGDSGYQQYGPSTACTTTCTADGKSNCGGAYASQVYQVATQGNGTSYIGCFGDVTNSRALPFMATFSGATLLGCYNAAVSYRYVFYGLQYGSQCFLGNTTSYKQYGSSTACTMKCTDGNTCGGPNANSVWQVTQFPAVGYDYTDTSKWTLSWSDEFSGAAGSSFDTSKWQYDNVADGGNCGDNCHYPHDSSVASMDGSGNLQLTSYSVGSCKYNCPRVTTQGKFSQAFGRFVARIKVAKGTGVWPAFWLYSANQPYGAVNGAQWPNNGELDILELMGRVPNKVYGTAHFLSPSAGGSYGNAAGNQPVLPSGDFSQQYHTFALEWTATQLRWYYDGILYYTLNSNGQSSSTQFSFYTAGTSAWPFQGSNPFFAILDGAMGGNFDSGQIDCTIQKVTHLVDFVRVYKCGVGNSC